MNEELKPLGRTLQRIDRCPGKVATSGTECCVATGSLGMSPNDLDAMVAKLIGTYAGLLQP